MKPNNRVDGMTEDEQIDVLVWENAHLKAEVEMHQSEITMWLWIAGILFMFGMMFGVMIGNVRWAG